MTARCLPAEPQFASMAERAVWERLRDVLPASTLLLSNLRITDQHKDHEADLVALVPDAGVVVIEAKGGSVWFDEDGWWQSGNGVHRIDPVDQAHATMYALRDYVEADPRWSRRRITWGHAVATPYSRFPRDFSAPDCPRWRLHDADDLADLGERVVRTAQMSIKESRPPSASDLELVSEILRGRSFTDHDRNAEAMERQAHADRLTAEQGLLLRATRLLNRVEVRGGAGSGKTMLALAQAKELTRGRPDSDVPPQRVALLCYSIGLGQFLRRQVESWPRQLRPAYAGTFHDLGRRLGAPEGDREDSDSWEEELPAIMAELSADLGAGEKYDAIIVDEAQDFADSWWIPLLRALKDPERGGLYVYSDENQRIFARYGRPPVPLVPLVLDHNLRNTRQIHESFGPLAPTRMTSRGGEGVDVHLLPGDGDPVGVADDAIEILIEVGWSPGNIALLTTGKRHPEQVNRTDLHGQVGYWRSYWDDEVFYGHVLGCKGLERPAVVLCLNEDQARDRSREKLYVGMSRATDQLIVVGERDLVREIGGPAVAERLGL